MIDKDNPFPDLKKLFTFFLGTNGYGQNTYNKELPVALRELFDIRDIYEGIKPQNSLFGNQDYLVRPSKIKGDKQFDFLVENQSCWRCETEMGEENPRAYVHDAESIGIEGRNLIPDSLNNFLTTYALQELAFELNYDINSIERLWNIHKSPLKIEPVWIDKAYILDDAHRYNFWLVEDDCLLMECSIRYLATNNKEKFDYVSNVLEPYRYVRGAQ